MATILIQAAVQAAVAAAVSVGLSYVRAILTPDQNLTNEGAKLNRSQLTAAAEGVAIARHWGRNRLGGNVIWSTRFKETRNVESQTSGGKGAQNKTTSETVTYTYSVSFAVAFCEGHERVKLGRVWADGVLLDLSQLTYRFYPGTEMQNPDSLIQTKEGSDTVPAYRGITYLVFENMELGPYGNRVPQITAEIIKGPKSVAADHIEALLRGVALIPASGEFAYGSRE